MSEMKPPEGDKVLLLGNEAFARGAYEAGVKVSSAYPGTPSTEISEALAAYKDDLYCEWAPNEKVALEVAIGASLSGVRALASMKHVGLNVAADPLYTASYIGVNGGLVLIVADDPGLYSSQNEQDTRTIAMAAHVPVLEPSDSAEARDYMAFAYDISETYDTPVIVRSTSRLSHSQDFVTLKPRVVPESRGYVKDIAKHVMVPANAKKRKPFVLERDRRLAEAGAAHPVNRVEMRDRSIGVITSGIPYQHVREALPDASVLKLGMVSPLPRRLIEDFAAQVDELWIIEELEPVIETQVRSWGIACMGKTDQAGNEQLPLIGEYTTRMLKDVILGERTETAEAAAVPARPPILCPGCPHRSVFHVLKNLKIHAAGDIGCYTLGASAPLEVIDTTVCMGASLGTLHGLEKALGRENTKKWVAVIGDSTFLHSGVNSLINMVYNGSKGTILILDNSTTAMTGHQDNPATGKTLQGDEAPRISLPDLCRSIGVKQVTQVDAFDQKELTRVIREETGRDELSVIICEGLCVLLKERPVPDFTYHVEKDECRQCGVCRRSGCPALTVDEDGDTYILPGMCTSCGLCFQVCPYKAIRQTALKSTDKVNV